MPMFPCRGSRRQSSLGGYSKHLRTRTCLCCTLEDVYIVLCLAVSLAALAACLLCAFNAFNSELWRRIYTTCFLGFGALCCFLQAVPSWRLRSAAPHLMAAVALLSFGSALGFLLSLIWNKGLTAALKHLKDAEFSGFLGFDDLQFDEIPQYVDSIVLLGSLGFVLALFSIIHEFGLKNEVYPRVSPSKYLIFLTVTGSTSLWTTALGVLAVNPGLSHVTTLHNRDLILGTVAAQPTFVISGLMFAGAVAATSLLFRQRRAVVLATIFTVGIAVSHMGMMVFSLIDFNIDAAEWNEFPNPHIGVMFATSSTLLSSTVLCECFLVSDLVGGLHWADDERIVSREDCRFASPVSKSTRRPGTASTRHSQNGSLSWGGRSRGGSPSDAEKTCVASPAGRAEARLSIPKPSPRLESRSVNVYV